MGFTEILIKLNYCWNHTLQKVETIDLLKNII